MRLLYERAVKLLDDRIGLVLFRPIDAAKDPSAPRVSPWLRRCFAGLLMKSSIAFAA